MRELAVRSPGFDDFAIDIIGVLSRKNFYKSANIAHIYRLKQGVALAKDRKHRQVAGKLCKPLMRDQCRFKNLPSVLYPSH
jgi:hypothetical protein